MFDSLTLVQTNMLTGPLLSFTAHSRAFISHVGDYRIDSNGFMMFFETHLRWLWTHNNEHGVQSNLAI